MNSSEQTPIEFPCRFPIKAMGLTGHDPESLVVDILRRHAPDLAPGDVTRRHSSAGKYVSITVTITATSREQLDAIYRELSACEQVLVAL